MSTPLITPSLVGSRHLPFAVLAAILAALSPLTARAEHESPPAASRGASARDPGTRLRFGFGGEGGWFGTTGNLHSSNPSLGLGALGLYLRVGVQINDLVGVHVTGAASSLLATGYARGALVVDLSPVPFLSVGTGLTAVGTYKLWRDGVAAVTILGAPIALGFHMGGRSPRTGARHGLGITLTGTMGHIVAGELNRGSAAFEGGAALSIGYEAR